MDNRLPLPEPWGSRLKWLLIVFVPAFLTLYGGLGLPNFSQVSLVTTTVATFLGAIFAVGQVQYNKAEAAADKEFEEGSIYGEIIVEEGELDEPDKFQIDIGENDPAEVEHKERVILTVRRP